ncbi:hypothetical protein HK100_005118 [Physocladia obscura]|uniref:Uncharacterized protein n=1 Tax=Physocladia obscura TaxID=109957 RepID=A0AAD5X9J1_9FUNG|nr:hypothetical protein HK100_005118 [Physocladia obscura]
MSALVTEQHVLRPPVHPPRQLSQHSVRAKSVTRMLLLPSASVVSPMAADVILSPSIRRVQSIGTEAIETRRHPRQHSNDTDAVVIPFIPLSAIAGKDSRGNPVPLASRPKVVVLRKATGAIAAEAGFAGHRNTGLIHVEVKERSTAFVEFEAVRVSAVPTKRMSSQSYSSAGASARTPAKSDIAARPAAPGVGVPMVRHTVSNPQTLHHSIYNQSSRDNNSSGNTIKYRSLRIPMIPLTSISLLQTNNALPLTPPKMISVRQTATAPMNLRSRSRSISPRHKDDHNRHDDDQQQHASLRKLEKKLKRISAQMDELKLLEEQRDSGEDEMDSIVVPNLIVGVVSPSRSFSKRGSRNSVS